MARFTGCVWIYITLLNPPTHPPFLSSSTSHPHPPTHLFLFYSFTRDVTVLAGMARFTGCVWIYITVLGAENGLGFNVAVFGGVAGTSHPSTHQSIHLLLVSSTHPPTHLPINPSNYVSSHPSTYSSVNQPTHALSNQSTHLLINPPTHPPTHPPHTVFTFCAFNEFNLAAAFNGVGQVKKISTHPPTHPPIHPNPPTHPPTQTQAFIVCGGVQVRKSPLPPTHPPTHPPIHIHPVLYSSPIPPTHPPTQIVTGCSFSYFSATEFFAGTG